MAGFGDRLRAAMYVAGLQSAQELAKRCGASRQTCGNWLRMDRADLSAAWLFPLADCLHVRARWLATGEGALPNIADEHWRRVADIIGRLPPEGVEEWFEFGEKLAGGE